MYTKNKRDAHNLVNVIYFWEKKELAFLSPFNDVAEKWTLK
jgi:hypothetical protein